MWNTIKISILLCLFTFCGVFLSACQNPKFAAAEKFYKETEYDKALQIYDELLKETDRQAEVHKLIGDVHFAKNEFEAAFENYKRSIEIDPQFATEKLLSFISYGDQGLRDLASDTIGTLENNREQLIEMVAEGIGTLDQYKKLDRLNTITRLGDRAVFITPKILPLLADKDWGVRQKAVEAVSAMGTDTMQFNSLGALIERLSDENDFVREEAARRLGDWGPFSEPAVPALLNLLTDKTEMVRNSADAAIDAIGKAKREQTAELVKILNSQTGHSLYRTLEVLQRMGTEANETVAGIIPLLKHPDRDISVLAAHALMQIGRAAESTIPQIIELARDGDENVRARVAYELGDVEKYSAEVMDALVKMKNDDSAQVRSSVAEAITKLETKKP